MSRSRLLVLDVVGMTPSLLSHAPRLGALAQRGFSAPMDGVLPGVTCTAQATLLTGAAPSVHGVVANGWYFRDLAEVWLWRQSNHLVQGPRLVDELVGQDPPLTVAKMFWWYNMYSAAQISVTPRPQYHSNGLKLPDVYSHPAELGVQLQRDLGTFPLFDFWGPTASLRSTAWIADASLKVWREQAPDVMFVYLPHLDYDLQRLGPAHPSIPGQVAKVDREAGKLIDAALEDNSEIIALSEYGISAVSGTVEINRVLRKAGFLSAREAGHGELLDAGDSRAFAVADHQIAHVYVRDPADQAAVQELLRGTAGVDQVLGGEDRRRAGLDHPRSGELVAVSDKDRFFAYHYWLDDDRAPDFARTVDIHRKPGYDPSELFFDPDRPLLKAQLGWTLLRKKLGFRTLFNAISMKSDLARGSHGRLPEGVDDAPMFVSSSPKGECEQVAMTSVKGRILDLLS